MLGRTTWGLVTLWAVVTPALAAARVPLASLRADVDGDGAPEAITLDSDGGVTVGTTSWGRLVGAPPFTGAALEVVKGDGATWLHVQARAGDGIVEWVAVRGEVRFSGRTGPDRDGERVLELGLGADGLRRWWRAPTVQRCDGEGRLFRERWVGGRFVPEPVAAPSGEPVTAVAVSAGRARPVFHWTAASVDSAAGPERRADLLSAPRELSDGNVQTFWIGGSGDWVVARATDGMRPVTELVVRGEGKLVWMVGSRRFRFAVAGDAPMRVRLPASVPADCVALVAEGPSRIAEAEVFTDLDGEGALIRLVAEALSDGEARKADGAVRLLRAEGTRGILAAAAALPTALAPGRRRLLELVAEAANPATAPQLAGVLRTGGSNERAVVRRGLARLGAVGERAAVTVLEDATEPDEARADAAMILGISRALPEARTALDQALATKPNPPVRQAILAALATRIDAAWLDVLAARSGDSSDDTALLHAAAPLAPRWPEPFVRAMASAWARLPPDAFAARLVWLRTATQLALPGLVPTLQEASSIDDDVLRATAVEALVALGPVRPELADDPSPRVRRAALAGLGAEQRRQALAGDAWPLVRRTAAGALECKDPLSVAALETALAKDRSDEVRIATLQAVARCAPSSPAITALLLDEKSGLGLRERAAALLGRPRDHAAAQALAKTILGVLDASMPDDRRLFLVEACLQSLGKTGDRSQGSLDAVSRAIGEPISPVRAAGIEALGRLCPKDAGAVLKRAASDGDPAVRRAASRALTACGSGR